MLTIHSKLVVLCFLGMLAVTAAAAVTYRQVLTEEWAEFKARYNKSYANESEDNYRFKVFLDNRHSIAKHNRRAANGQHQYTLKLNKYSDLTHEEFVKTMNGYKGPKRIRQDRSKLNPFVAAEYWALAKEPDTSLPTSLDWRQHGYVTPVKDQGHCGSCWAFSSTGALEGQHFRTTGDLISLSEQNLIDCSEKYGNRGCNGGLMEYAFEYIKANHGIDTENSYPYEAHDSKCRFKNKTVGADEKGYVEISAGDERKLLQALAKKGPISVAIDASQESFRHYDGGVYDEPNCSEDDLDHAVLLVGYGTDPVHGDYWLVKNSWSESWGQAGYIKMSRNKENQCGIATNAVYPVV